MKKFSRSKKSGKGSQNKSALLRRVAKRDGPPEYVAGLALGWRQRYAVTGSALQLAVTRQQLWNAIVTATSPTVAYSQFSAIKVNRIRIWGPIADSGTGGFQSIFLTWFSTYSPAVVHSDTQIGGAAMGSYLDTRPPRDSLAAKWSMAGTNGTEEVFGINVPAGAIIDVDYSVRLQNTFYGAALPASVTVVGATPGTQYVLPLDFQFDLSTSYVVPVGVTSIL
jgi:hypothetical protein